jgi:beta-phosphoglucomutase-like phosphatase (HAD superfamily)
MIKGAIFDADGTLLDSMGMWDTVGQRYLASLGVAARPGLRQELFPLSLAQCAVYLRDHYALPLEPKAIEDGINGIIRHFYCQEVEAKAGAREFLAQLRWQGVKCTLATATEHSVIEEGLKRTGLFPLLDGLYTCGDLNTSKGEPYIFDYARDAMGTRTEDTWVFEDAVHAASTAYRAGYPVAGVADPYSDQEALKKVCHVYLPNLLDFDGFYERAK